MKSWPKAESNRCQRWALCRTPERVAARLLACTATQRSDVWVPNRVSGFALAGFLICSLPALAADPQSQQIERARVLREIDEAGVQTTVLPPASIETEQFARERIEAEAIAADQRWHRLLGAQQRETHVEDPAKVGPRLRQAQAQRQQQAADLVRQIQRDAIDYRMKNRP